MSIFSNLRIYAGKWEEKDRIPFPASDANQVKEAVVVESQYGLSVRFELLSGGITFIPLSRDAKVGLGEVIDLSKAELVTLSKSGENDIWRIYA